MIYRVQFIETLTNVVERFVEIEDIDTVCPVALEEQFLNEIDFENANSWDGSVGYDIEIDEEPVQEIEVHGDILVYKQVG